MTSLPAQLSGAACYSYGRFKDAAIVVQTTAVAKDHPDLLHIK